MNKSQLKAFQSIVGNFSPYFSKLNNECLFLDSDLSGEADKNRQVAIFNVDAKVTDLILTIKGFDQVENNLFKGQVFLKTDENKEVLICEPSYYLNKNKFSFSTHEIQSYIKEIWYQALNEYKATLNESPITSNFDKSNFSIVEKLSSLNKPWLSMAVIAGVIILAGGGYVLGSGSSAQNGTAVSGAQQIITSDNPELDGKAMALKNMGLDPNSMAFDNSCFTDK